MEKHLINSTTYQFHNKITDTDYKNKVNWRNNKLWCPNYLEPATWMSTDHKDYLGHWH